MLCFYCFYCGHVIAGWKANFKLRALGRVTAYIGVPKKNLITESYFIS